MAPLPLRAAVAVVVLAPFALGYVWKERCDDCTVGGGPCVLVVPAQDGKLIRKCKSRARGDLPRQQSCPAAALVVKFTLTLFRTMTVACTCPSRATIVKLIAKATV